MQMIDNFYVDDESTIHLNTHEIVVRCYNDTSKKSYTDITFYLNDELYKEWIEQLIPKHILYELLSERELNTEQYRWMDGIKLQSGDYAAEIERISTYGSIEAYRASQLSSWVEFAIDVDYRLSKQELGI